MNREFIKQRILIFSGVDFDPCIDSQVVDVLQKKFNIYLPQRASLDAALEAAISDHEIIDLISQYRATP
ncbi:hypothetical protein [Teredinibacter franksiae]|uniref:hypothetical protein n=1 Tax=Teredinibacter franksiae TaxID=2761453 RepID=UPI001627257D|nr:hypothetical protein [Teredinibacter franksiae]